MNERKTAGHVPVTAELLRDTSPDWSQLLEVALDQVVRPWRYPDPNPMPVIVLFPRLARLAAWWAARRQPDAWEDE